MDRRPHATDTWTGHTLIGPGTAVQISCTLSGQLAVHRQLGSSFRHNRFLGQSDEDVYLMCENINRRTKGLLQTAFYTAIKIGLY